jgi:hypothetical protein
MRSSAVRETVKIGGRRHAAKESEIRRPEAPIRRVSQFTALTAVPAGTPLLHLGRKVTLRRRFSRLSNKFRVDKRAVRAMAFIGLALLPEPADKCGIVDIPPSRSIPA